MRYRKQMKWLVAIALVAIVTTAVTTTETLSVLAHHGWSEYNNKQTLNLTGTIRRIRYDNPHTVIDLETTDKKIWTAVLAPPSRMQRRGLPQSDLKVGATVRLVGYPHQTDQAEMRAERIILGQRTVELR
jgi:hypothetical protein